MTKTAGEITLKRIKRNIREDPKSVDIDWLAANGYHELVRKAESAKKFNAESDEYNKLRFEAALELHKVFITNPPPWTYTADDRATYAVREADALLRRLKETNL